MPARPARQRGQTGHPPAARRRHPVARRVPPPRSALGPTPGGRDRPRAHLGGARGRTGSGAGEGRREPPPCPPGPRAPLTSAHGPGGLTRRGAPPPLPQPGRAAGRRGLRAAAAAAASPASAASPPLLLPSSRLSALRLRRRRPSAPAPARRPRQSPGPRPTRAALASPWSGPAARGSQPPGTARPGPRLHPQPPRGAGSGGPAAAGTPPRRPPGAPPRASALPPAGRTGGPAGAGCAAPKSGPGPEVRPRTGQWRRAGVGAALRLPMPRDPAGRAPGAERAPSPGHRRTLTRHTLAPARPR